MIERVFQLDKVSSMQIGELGKQFYARTGLPGHFKTDTFTTFWNGFLNSGHAAQWVWKEKGLILGTIGMTLTLSFMDGKVIADEQFWFVHPHHRGTAGVRLFVEMRNWAEQSGAQRILMGKMLAVDPENDKVGKFYERQGFRALQTQYVLDL